MDPWLDISPKKLENRPATGSHRRENGRVKSKKKSTTNPAICSNFRAVLYPPFATGLPPSPPPPRRDTGVGHPRQVALQHRPGTPQEGRLRLRLGWGFRHAPPGLGGGRLGEGSPLHPLFLSARLPAHSGDVPQHPRYRTEVFFWSWAPNRGWGGGVGGGLLLGVGTSEITSPTAKGC